MKSKRILAAFFAALFAIAASADPSVSQVIVRQQWPWKTAVNVEFVASGFSGAYREVSLAAYDGDVRLGTVPKGAMSGDRIIGKDGLKRLTFDPSAVDFLKSCKYIANFRIVPELTAVDASKILYMIVDLTRSVGAPGAVDYVTEDALTGGEWGSWQQKVWSNGPDVPVWTGVTEDPKYKTTHLVLRRVKAGTFVMGSPVDENGRSGVNFGTDVEPMYYGEVDNEIQHEVTITRDFFIGVFPLTSGQWKLIQGSYRHECPNPNFPEVPFESYPAELMSYESLRGANQGAGWPNADPTVAHAVDQGSFLFELRRRTGLMFDLPTEAQWEFACRGGTTTAFNNGYNAGGLGPGEWLGSNCPELYDAEAEIAGREGMFDWVRTGWYCKCSGGVPCPVGLLHPNSFGLYDCMGNIAELCLDWYQDNLSAFTGNDPVGPVSSVNGNRVIRGGLAWSNWHECRSAARNSFPPAAENDRAIGVRLTCPVE